MRFDESTTATYCSECAITVFYYGEKSRFPGLRRTPLVAQFHYLRKTNLLQCVSLEDILKLVSGVWLFNHDIKVGMSFLMCLIVDNTTHKIRGYFKVHIKRLKKLSILY